MLHVRSYKQTASYCGPASLKMVLDYFGVNKTEQELARLSGCTRSRGAGAHGLIAAARRVGFQGLFKDNCDFKDIRYYVNVKKIPILTDWFSPFPPPEGHYAVVVGIDRRFIYLQDPQVGRIRRMDLKTFKLLWFDFPGDYLRSKRDIIIRRIIVIDK